jgi:cyclophilin family peptidyl-prolyl cis-trans isomerase
VASENELLGRRGVNPPTGPAATPEAPLQSARRSGLLGAAPVRGRRNLHQEIFSMKRLLFAALASLLAGGGCSDAPAPSAEAPQVLLKTSMGDIKIELYPDKAPITVKNFLAYVDAKFYDGTIFHRVIGKPHSEKDFMIQGGGFLPGLKEKDGLMPPIKNESGNGLSNVRGSIAMARTRDLDSATAQFYINLSDNLFLDQGRYCAFGKVIEGMDVVDKIKAVEVRDVGPHEAVPVKDVVILSARRVEK